MTADPKVTLEQIRDDIQAKLIVLFDQWDEVDSAEQRRYVGGQIESFMYLMASIDRDRFTLLSADRQKRLGADDWIAGVTEAPDG